MYIMMQSNCCGILAIFLDVDHTPMYSIVFPSKLRPLVSFCYLLLPWHGIDHWPQEVAFRGALFLLLCSIPVIIPDGVSETRDMMMKYGVYNSRWACRLSGH